MLYIVKHEGELIEAVDEDDSGFASCGEEEEEKGA